MDCRLDDFGTSPLFFMDNTQTVCGGGLLQACEKAAVRAGGHQSLSKARLSLEERIFCVGT
jgi:hypothetical protein